jgi:outer membrane protein TolC
MKFHENATNEENQKAIDLMQHDSDILLKQYEQQHKDFVNHANSQIESLQAQINQLIQQQQQLQTAKSNLSTQPIFDYIYFFLDINSYIN